MEFSKDLKMFNHRPRLGARGRGRGVRGGAGVRGWEQDWSLLCGFFVPSPVIGALFPCLPLFTVHSGITSVATRNLNPRMSNCVFQFLWKMTVIKLGWRGKEKKINISIFVFKNTPNLHSDSIKKNKGSDRSSFPSLCPHEFTDRE